MQDVNFREDEPSYLLTRRNLRARPKPCYPARSIWGSFAPPALPYPENALAPVISATAVGSHYRKHHKTHIESLNKLLKDSPYEYMQLEQILDKTHDDPATAILYHHAAEAWNHWFYWQSLKPGGGRPAGSIAEKIDADFGGFEHLENTLVQAALSQLGNGWVWLVEEGGRLWVIKTGNADTPLVHGLRPLLAIDVWEHAYYPDYAERRPEYVRAVIDKLLNWKFAQKNLFH